MARRVCVPDPAAVLPGEMPFLRAVTANLADHTAKLVYADWLDEHNDPRGEYLRAFARAVQNDKLLPITENMPSGWCETVGAPLVARLRAADLGAYVPSLLPLARPVLELIGLTAVRDGRVTFGGSRLGGLPALARGSDWPRCKSGPLAFLAQFDLADLHATVAGQVLPPAGVLSFFEYQDFDMGEHGPPLVVFTPPEETLEVLEPPDDLQEETGRPGDPYTFQLRESLDLPAATDPWAAQLGFPGVGAADCWEVRDRYWQVQLAQRGITHVLFGYARPRHLACDPIPGSEWEQLASFASDDDLQWGWGDGHELFWYVRSDDLRAARFDRTEAHDG